MAEVKRDDGVNVETAILINGWNRDGLRLPPVTVSSKAYDRMGWVMDNWGFYGNIMPGSTTKDNLRYVVAAAGEKCAVRYTEYNHTGWRKIAGKWAFLYQGGAIGADSVSVELGSGLQSYRLDGDGNPDFDAMPRTDSSTYDLAVYRLATHFYDTRGNQDADRDMIPPTVIGLMHQLRSRPPDPEEGTEATQA